MKTMRYAFIWVSVSLAALALAAQQTNQPAKELTAALENAQPATAATTATTNAAVETPPATNAAAPAAAAMSAADSPASTNGAVSVAMPFKPLAPGQKGLRFNFRGVPLETVLNYMSEAAGFIIVKDTEVRGRVDAWSYEPLTKEEAVQLLNTVLYRNGYAAIQNDRTLTIVSKDEAKKRDILVIKESDPTKIPRADVIVTQIIPVRYANAIQLTKDLLPLLPTSANMTANESANALVITDTQANIRRMALIVNALDTSISAISKIQVLRLQYADAKELANIIKELYPAPSSSGRSSGGRGGGQDDMRAMFMARMGGGPGGGGQPGPTSTGTSEAKMAASRVTAVADERNNVLVVSAPDEIMPSIEELVKQLDKNAEELTEFRVFHLANSDPVEMTDLLTQLFPDQTRSNSGGGRASIMFGGMGGRGMMGGMGGRGSGSSQNSSYAQKKGQVLAVPDQRTSSVIVSASSEMMPQIGAMIAQLDANPAKSQKVYVFPLENADVANVETILRGMFEGQNSRNTRTTTGNQQNNQLNNRSLFNQGQNSSSGASGRGASSRGGGGF